MTLGLVLLVLGTAAVAVPPVRAAARWVGVVLAVGLLAAVLGEWQGLLEGAAAADVLDLLAEVTLLAVAGDDVGARLLLLGAIVWCGPAADLVVRAVLDRTNLPAPERAAEAGYRAGRWVGRLERWTLLVVVAAGQPALAVIPAGGKALLRYAEAVADARAGRDGRLAVPDQPPSPGRDAFLDYVLVGSLASWSQALVLGLVVAAIA